MDDYVDKPMTAIILAGGKATRLKGFDKAFLSIGRETLINRQLRLLKELFKRVIIVTNSPHKFSNPKDIKVTTDIIPNLGPLAGIFTGLLASKDKYNFVVACDMPFINPNLIRYMCKNKSGYDIVVPRVNGRYEPLYCIYSKNCLGSIKQLLDKKVFKITKFFSKVKVREVTEAQILKFASPELIFMNINTPKDFAKLSHE